MIQELFSPQNYTKHSLINTQPLLINQPPFFIKASAPITDQLKQDIQQCQHLLNSINQGQDQLLKKVLRLKEQFQGANLNSGIDYFDAKNMIMSQYLVELHFYVLFKLNGIDLTTGKGFELYKNLLYLKTLLMKLGPVEKKLQYKTQKILREGTSSFSSNKQKQAISLKPNPKNLMEDRTVQNTEAKAKKYIVPKMTAALMPQDKQKARQAKNIQRRKQHLQRKLRDNFRDEDEQVEANMISQYDRRALKKFREREQLQESQFRRLPQTRKDKKERERLEKLRISDVGDLSEMRQMKELLKYSGMIQQDFEKERKADKLLSRKKKIHKKTGQR